MKITKTKQTSIKKSIFMSFALLFCLGSLQAQVSIFTENFNGTGHAFTLNTSSQSSAAAGYNPWVVNNSFVGGSGSLICLSFPFNFTVGNSTPQPAGITGSPNSNYMHITSQEAIDDGITCASYQSADGTCYLAENYFTEMTNNISTTGFTNVNFKFWWMCGGAAGTTFGEVYFSLDGGTVWYAVTGTNQYLNNTNWSQATVTDPAFDNQTQIKFGFRFVNMIATAGLDPGFSIDDILVEGTAATSCDSDSTFSVTACDTYTSPSGKVWTATNTYMDTIPNTASCDSVITISLTINTANASVTANGMMLAANSGGAIYQWVDCNNGNAPIPGETNQVFNVTANGNYAVEVTENGCTSTSTCFNITGVGINNIEFESSIQLYPNPSSGIIQLDLKENYSNVQIRISNINGQLVFDQRYNQANKLNLNLTNLASGVYFVSIRTENKSAIMKLIKQ